jgi:hypothetical protein
VVNSCNNILEVWNAVMGLRKKFFSNEKKNLGILLQSVPI